MTVTLVDTNVLLDVFTADTTWLGWSGVALESCANDGLLAVNPIIYAEVSAGFDSAELLEAVMPADVFQRLPLPWEAAFLAGKAYLAYRRRGGPRPSLLPDFYIGAHAAVRGFRLLTRDATRYRTYFPTVELVAP